MDDMHCISGPSESAAFRVRFMERGFRVMDKSRAGVEWVEWRWVGWCNRVSPGCRAYCKFLYMYIYCTVRLKLLSYTAFAVPTLMRQVLVGHLCESAVDHPKSDESRRRRLLHQKSTLNRCGCRGTSAESGKPVPNWDAWDDRSRHRCAGRQCSRAWLTDGWGFLYDMFTKGSIIRQVVWTTEKPQTLRLEL